MGSHRAATSPAVIGRDGGAPAARSLRSLTSLRFAAALLVFAVHSDVIPHVKAGRSGVSFFFLLSGFVLAWSARDGDTVRAFWRRRAARILPAYFAAWGLGLVVSATEGPVRWITTIPGLLLVQAWFPSATVHFAGDGVAWSLSCEVLFYASFPLLYRQLRHVAGRRLWIVLTGCLAVSMAVPAVVHSADPNAYWVYIFPPFRLLEFVVGMILAILYRRGWRTPVPLWVSCTGCLLALALASAGPVWSSAIATTVVPYALVITSAARCDLEHSDSRGLRRPALVRLGSWSYCFYLVHQLVIRVVVTWGAWSSVLPVLAVDLIASIVISAVLYRWLEQPLERILRSGRITTDDPDPVPAPPRMSRTERVSPSLPYGK